MFRAAFSGFSVKDLAVAEKYYSETLGLKVDNEDMGLKLHLPDGGTVYVYDKDDHQPATFTILNFVVDKIDDAVAELAGRGVTFEKYEGMTDDKGIARGISANRGPDIAWFKDPDGNVLSVLQNA
jgi:catechol 2,3-dioxygenase-like lactoylglutathione lyase family enzyme